MSADAVDPSALAEPVMSKEASTLGPWRAIVQSARMAAAESLIVQSGSSDAAVAQFWETIAVTPLWERDPELSGAWRATFLWRGAPEETRHVTLCGPVVFSEIFGCPLAQIPATDIWHLTLRLPPQTRSMYAFSANGRLDGPVEIGDIAGIYASWTKDPLNPHTFMIPANSEVPEFTPKTYSLIEAPDAGPQPWSTPQPGVASGELDEHIHASETLQNTRRVWTYTPAGWDPREREYPLLIAFDGWDAVNVSHLPVVLDNLIAAGEIPPVVAVLIDSGTLAMRGRELDCHEPFLTYLTDEVLPWAAERWKLLLDRSRTLVAGVSLGGRTALFAGLRRPDLFGKVIAQSAAVTELEPATLDALASHVPTRASEKLDIYMDVGLLEVDNRGERAFLVGVRRMREMLENAGHSVHHAELACGHDDGVLKETVAYGLQLLIGTSADRED